jgi:hypothetical protein
MSNYLSHIASRSSGIAPENFITPQGALSYTSANLSDDIAVEANETVTEKGTQEFNSYHNTLNKPITPKALVKQEQAFNVAPPPLYLYKHIERLSVENIEKSVFYDPLDTLKHQKTEVLVSDIDLFIDQEQNPKIGDKSYLSRQSQNQIFGNIQETEEKKNPAKRQKSILTSNTDGVRNLDALGKDIAPKHLKPTLQPENSTNERVKLQPSTLALETPIIKKTVTSPKLVIGRITVEVLPPVAPLVKTIVRTVERSSGASNTSDNTIHKLSFGLGQL